MVNFTTSIKLSGGYIQMKNTAINLQDLFLNNAKKRKNTCYNIFNEWG